MTIAELLNTNIVLFSAIIGWVSAQVLKTLIHLILSHKFVIERLVGSGGMPSCHSSTVCALATSALLHYGFDSFEFAISAIFAIVVMYDAMGVRRQAGKQAVVLNQLICLFQDLENRKISTEQKLKELVGHTPLQVFAGAILGVCVSLSLYFTLH